MTDPSETSGINQRKMAILITKPSQPKGVALSNFLFFAPNPSRQVGQRTVLSKWNGKFQAFTGGLKYSSRTDRTEIDLSIWDSGICGILLKLLPNTEIKQGINLAKIEIKWSFRFLVRLVPWLRLKGDYEPLSV